MRFTYFIACCVAASHGGERALGIRPEYILSPDFVWLNWILVALWLMAGVYAFVWRP